MSGSGEPIQWPPSKNKNQPPRKSAKESGYAAIREPECAGFHSNNWIQRKIPSVYRIRNPDSGKYLDVFDLVPGKRPYGVLFTDREKSGDLELRYDPGSVGGPYYIAWNDWPDPAGIDRQFKALRDGDQYYHDPTYPHRDFATPPTPILGTVRLVWYVKDGNVVSRSVEGAEEIAHVVAYMIQPGKSEPAAAGGASLPTLWVLEPYNTDVWLPDGIWTKVIASKMGIGSPGSPIVPLEVRRPVLEMGRGFDLQKEGGDESKGVCVSWALVILYWVASEANKGLNLRTAGVDDFKRMYTFLHDNPEYKSQISGVVSGGKRTRTRRKRRGRRLTRRR